MNFVKLYLLPPQKYSAITLHGNTVKSVHLPVGGFSQVIQSLRGMQDQRRLQASRAWDILEPPPLCHQHCTFGVRLDVALSILI